ncbi:hypothetical protein F0562_020683 [Nyssa sinensis]|uniref:Protein kinase domain-containing protein n=1 Tax=Nyssa sinensis TaxID=561372 RepID=A0A5J5BT62_9ASTE|nr:hypothetical protein F0562_020683 [Nyssa sinensis]
MSNQLETLIGFNLLSSGFHIGTSYIAAHDTKQYQLEVAEEDFRSSMASSVEGSEDLVKSQVLATRSYGTVYLARIPHSRILPPIIAVKSEILSDSSSLQKERKILQTLSGCPEIIRCYGDRVTIENQQQIYNLLLEYAPGGILSDLMRSHGNRGKLPEADVRNYSHMILKGICYMHQKGYVHGDIKPSNIHVFPAPDGVISVKIADFGLSKRSGNGEIYVDGRLHVRGTPLYASPESVRCNMNEPPMDIWSLGCIIVEMVTGTPVWSCTTMEDLLHKIAFDEEEFLEIVDGLMSVNGKDFVYRCLIREPDERWTAKMLLDHPFIVGDSKPVVMIDKFFPFLTSTPEVSHH